ncbi:hypothetical protein Kpho02_38500 [Kitasatospora phosalacinea]|uniref:Uncharacterized protein n=1 Tax=Kitasatospora phosalacinea TaxID=2065 RepID=A0A9W6V1C9_9ACTN|nr:hypothetical protein Kpho02_38500 [Kitasatospora phosalacinea]
MAGLLARQGRIDELCVYAAGEHHGSATQCLAEELEARGDVDGAAAPYRHPGNPEHRRGPRGAAGAAAGPPRAGRCGG